VFQAISCASDDRCVAVDATGDEVTFDPRDLDGAAGATIDAPGGHGATLTAVSCPSATQCTAVDATGGVVSFDPANPSVDPTNPIAGSAPMPVVIDTQTAAPSFSAISCPTTGICVAVDQGGVVYTFDPASPTTGENAMIGGGESYLSVSCPSANQCTAVDELGDAVTFDPANLAGASGGPVDGGTALSSVSCPSAFQCTAVDAQGAAITLSFEASGAASTSPPRAVTIDPGGVALVGVSCPSTGQCTAIDQLGQAITFDPISSALLGTTTLDTTGVLRAIACPSTSQCSAVDTSGQQFTFAPAPFALVSHSVLDGGAGGVPNELAALSCPGTSLCTAVDNAGNAVTFTPATGALDASAPVDASALTAVSCPSVSTCVAVDDAGQAVSFDPSQLSGAKPSPVSIDPAPLDAIVCRADYCLAVDSAGDAVQGNIGALGSWKSGPIPGAGVLEAVSLVNADQVIAVDASGNAFLGALPPPPPVPTSTPATPPTVAWPSGTGPAPSTNSGGAPLPAGVSAGELATALTATVPAGHALRLERRASGSTARLTVPRGALPAGTTVALAAISDTSWLGTVLPAADAYVLSFSVAWRAPDGTVPRAARPVTLTISDPAIRVGDVVERLTAHGLLQVGRATENGTLTLTFSSDPAFILAAPPRLEMMAPAVLAGRTVRVALACISGLRCVGIARLTVVHQMRSGARVVLRPVVLAAGRFRIGAGGHGPVTLRLGARGHGLFVRFARRRVVRLSLVVQTVDGSRIVRRIPVRT
jgi:hypothetical protein